MALFGSDRDMSLFRSVNRELINRYIDIEVVLYKLALSATDINIYGESDRKTYYQPVRMNALIARDATSATDDGYGIDKGRTALFSFLKPDLIYKNLVIEIGDIIYWDLEYVAGRNENTDIGVNERGIFGMDLSVIIEAHITRINGLNIIETRSGTSVVSSKPRNL